MLFKATHPPETWKAIKLASIRGVEDRALAESFGVEPEAIRKRRSRDPEWKAACVTPAKVKTSHGQVTTPSVLAVSEKVEAAVTDNLQQIGVHNQLLAAKYGHEAMKRSLEQGMVQDPTTWQEVAAVNKMVRLNTGLDKGENSVTLNLWGGYDAFGEPRDVTPNESQQGGL